MKKLKIFMTIAFLGIATLAMAQTANDRPLFDVVGKVKSITFKNTTQWVVDCWSVTFSPTGSMIKIDGKTPAKCGIKITSRTNGLPTKVRFSDIDDQGYQITWNETIRYNSNHKLLKVTSTDYPTGDIRVTFTYDSAGRLKSVETDNGVEGRQFTYKYISFDAKGNWTKRSAVIKHFGIDFNNGKKIYIDSLTEKETESRTITYY